MSQCVTMKTISIRQLHERTGSWVRSAAKDGRFVVSDRGRPVAVLGPFQGPPDKPFGKRKMTRGFASLPKVGGDSSRTISEERDR